MVIWVYVFFVFCSLGFVIIDWIIGENFEKFVLDYLGFVNVLWIKVIKFFLGVYLKYFSYDFKNIFKFMFIDEKVRW